MLLGASILVVLATGEDGSLILCKACAFCFIMGTQSLLGWSVSKLTPPGSFARLLGLRSAISGVPEFC